MVSAAAPLTAMAGGAPVAMLLGNGAGIPLAYVMVSVILLIFSVGYTAMARHHTSTGAFYSYVARGLRQPAGGQRRSSPCSATTRCRSASTGCSALTTVMSLLFITSLFAALLAFHNAAARYCYSLGRKGLVPARLGHTHAVHLSPHVG